MVRTVDSDVVVILLGFMSEFMAANPSVEITVDFKTSRWRKYISINSIYYNLGSDICSGLPFFHSFTGTDSTCSFFKQSKKDWFGKCLDLAMKEELDEKFRILSKCLKKDIADDCHFFDTKICGLCLPKKIWLRWIALSNVREFELKWFQSNTSIQRCPIPTSTVGILSIGMGLGEVIVVAGSSSSEGIMGLEDSRGKFKIQLENKWLLWQTGEFGSSLSM